MVYADFLGLRMFTRLNLMTQVYNGSPSQGHSGPGPAFVAAAPAVAAHPGPEQHGARRPAVVDVAPAVAAHPGPEPPVALPALPERRRGASRAAGPARPLNVCCLNLNLNVC